MTVFICSALISIPEYLSIHVLIIKYDRPRIPAIYYVGSKARNSQVQSSPGQARPVSAP